MGAVASCVRHRTNSNWRARRITDQDAQTGPEHCLRHHRMLHGDRERHRIRRPGNCERTSPPHPNDRYVIAPHHLPLAHTRKDSLLTRYLVGNRCDVLSSCQLPHVRQGGRETERHHKCRIARSARAVRGGKKNKTALVLFSVPPPPPPGRAVYRSLLPDELRQSRNITRRRQ